MNLPYTCQPDFYDTTMAKKPKKKQNDNTIARNRKARFDYTIESNFEAGLVLEGWEVKSLRAGKVQIDESYIFAKNGELEWIGGTITPLITTSTHIHASPTRARKILMHRHEIDRLIGQVERKGFTLVPLTRLAAGESQIFKNSIKYLRF